MLESFGLQRCHFHALEAVPEVECCSGLIAALCERLSLRRVLDVGSGEGYLGQGVSFLPLPTNRLPFQAPLFSVWRWFMVKAIIFQKSPASASLDVPGAVHVFYCGIGDVICLGLARHLLGNFGGRGHLVVQCFPAADNVLAYNHGLHVTGIEDRLAPSSEGLDDLRHPANS